MYLFLLETRECFRLNEISARIWELLAESGEPEAVVTQLMREYAVDERIARAEIANLITDWAEAKLLTIVEEGTDV